MATVHSTLVLDDKMSKTLKTILNNAEQLKGAIDSTDKNVNKLDNSMQKASSSSNGFLKSLIGFQAVKSIFSMITSQLGDAITRFDTLNNYVNVMSNLGISAEDAQASLDRMKVGLDGLPTTLQDGAMAVQRFTSANGNVKASTEMFLALNNAILAGGASTMTQASALEQLSQSYAKGKPDMMEWRTAMSAMPAQLNQVAKVMGFVNADALGESLRKGTTSMNQFMKTLVEMNKEGVNGFKSLDEQARNATGGIQTSLTNFKTAITKGLEDMIRTTNETLEKSGLPTIQKIIQTAGKKIQQILVKVGQIIGQVISFIAKNWSWIKPTLITLIGLLVTYKVVMGIASVVTKIATAVQSGYAASMWATVWPILAVIAAIITIIAILHGVIKIINAVTGETISTVGVIMGALNVLKTFIANKFVVPVWNSIAYLVNFFANCFKNPIAAIELLFVDLSIHVLDIFSKMIEGVESLLNGLIDQINKVADKLNVQGMGKIEVTKGIAATKGQLESFASKTRQEMGWVDYVGKLDIVDYGDAYQAGYNWGSNLSKGISDLFNMTSAANVSDLIDMGDIDWDSLNSTIGTDSTGGKAIKTTTKDNLLSDDDIQLLLDVATRDYKLNYQKVEPNITITFGDVNETADVDNILDKMADRLEEIYDSDLEVAR